MSLPILERYEQERNQRLRQHLGPVPTLTPIATHPKTNEELEKGLAGQHPDEEGAIKIWTPFGTQTLIPGKKPGEEEAKRTAKKIEELRGKTSAKTQQNLEQEVAGEAATKTKEENKAHAKKTGWEGAIETISELFEKLSEASFWVRVLKFGLGGVLIIVALFFFAHSAGAAGGQEASGVKTAGAVGGALKSPALSAISSAAGGAEKAAAGQRRRTTQVSQGRRKAVAEGQAREAKRPAETDKRGKPLAGGAATARERRRVKERAKLLGMKALE